MITGPRSARKPRDWLIAPFGAFVSVVLLFGTPHGVRADPSPADEAASVLAPGVDDSGPAQLTLREMLLAGSARLALEATVAAVDFEKLRGNAIRRIRAKSEQDYQRQINRIFDDLESVGVEQLLGISRGSTREEVIDVLERTDENGFLAAANDIPDASIAALLERKLRESGARSLSEAQRYLETAIADLVSGLSST